MVVDIDQIELIAGHPALDFVNTVESRESAKLISYVPDYDRFVRWCARADLVTANDADTLADQAVRHPIVASRVWDNAMMLREALNGIVRCHAAGAVPDANDVSAVNQAVAEAHASRYLATDQAGAIHWEWRDGQHGLAVPLWLLALAAADLVTADRAPIRVCANGPCDWVFLDTSRNGRRRWCRMHVCGNASKVRRFRERRRGQQ